MQKPLFPIGHVTSLQLDVERVAENRLFGLLWRHIVLAQMCSIGLIPLKLNALLVHLFSIYSLAIKNNCIYSVYRFVVFV